ncbi:MAG: restriction endonuclease subunit S [Glycocaulis sp.]
MAAADVPNSWETATISEVAETIFGQSPPSSSYNKDGNGLPFFQGKAEFGAKSPVARTWCTEPTREAQAGDILISVRAPVGPTNVADRHCAIGRGLAAIRPLISPEYVRFWFLRSEQVLAAKGTGTTFSAISKGILNNHGIPVAPLNEQRRIVEKVETLFARLDKGEEAIRTVQTLLARYRQSVLKAAVTGELTADWRAENAHRLEHGRDLLARILKTRRETWDGRGKYKEPAAPDTTGLPDLPKGWVWASLDSLIVDGPTNGISPKEVAKGGSLSFKLTATTSGEFLINDDTVKRVGIEPEEDSKYWLSPGDVLIQRGNTIEYVGTAAIFPGPTATYIYPDLMMRVRFSDSLLAKWTVRWINFELAKRHFRRLATGTAGNMPKINGTTLRSLPVPLPPRDEIATCLELIELIETRSIPVSEWCQTELVRSAALRQSILKDAFAGRLVPQDPADEPASALLARTKKAREAKMPVPRRRVG